MVVVIVREMGPLISGKSGWVKYYDLTRFMSIQVKVEGAKIPLHRIAKSQLLGNGWKWCMLHDVRFFFKYFNTFY